ncbi:MAG: 2-hydroxyhepta-2,4-diene-1,7-dioate isomerase [Nitrospirae bacterium RIFCSPHIGHO2_01_FULL_66_17]|nr:MAG: 2-hydroxyhepta-2,4-diene-1,7-dioate isomerase [Nitrospirae bacterium RIFCSPHIGHO2_01_FULL_66_17]
MRYLRFHHKDFVGYGRLEGDLIRAIEGDLFGTYKVTETTVPFAAARLLAPCLPTKIVAIGVNYKDHAAEFKKELPSEPLIFLKPPSALLAPEEAIVYPEGVTKRVDYEGELAVVIKKRARHVTIEQAAAAIFGYTCCNDVTARDLQKKDGQWSRAKGFDTFCPLGPVIATDVEPSQLRIRTLLNGDVKQDAPVSAMLFDVPTLVSYVSKVMTLLPGDIITTGTPSGVGPMQRGDVVEVWIEGIGRLRNRVV